MIKNWHLDYTVFIYRKGAEFNYVLKNFTDIGDDICDCPEEIFSYLDNIERLKLINILRDSEINDDSEYKSLENSSFETFPSYNNKSMKITNNNQFNNVNVSNNDYSYFGHGYIYEKYGVTYFELPYVGIYTLDSNVMSYIKKQY